MPMIFNNKKYASITEVSDILGVTTQRLRQLCGQDRIVGCFKEPTGNWMIPLPPRIIEGSKPARKIVMHAS